MRVLAVVGLQMQSVAVAWQIYALARQTMSIADSAFLLGLTGLAQFIPLFLLGLIGGQTADRFDRRLIITICFIVQIGLSIALIASTHMETKSAMICVFIVCAGFGIIRAFMPPAITALGPSLVPPDELPQAIAWNSLAFQGASIIGPAIGGFLYIASAQNVYFTCMVLLVLALIVVISTKTPKQTFNKVEVSTIRLIKEGVKFVWNNKIILGAISLDLAVVLMAGATALLPVFAKDILHVGPDKFALLRSAMAVGAALVAFALAMRPIRTNVGKWLFGAVILFGIATIGFGLSRTFWLAFFWLVVAGASDMISVYVRSTLEQIATPDAMRGRVAAVAMLFISASNELGEFETGLMAKFFGPVRAVVIGGIGAIIVAGAWIRLFQPLWFANRFEDAKPKE